MPYYDYYCKNEECGTEWEEKRSMDEVDLPTQTPCPNCQQMTVVLAAAAPLLADPVRLGVTKAPSDFDKYVLGKIKAKHPKHRMGNTKVSHAKEI